MTDKIIALDDIDDDIAAFSQNYLLNEIDSMDGEGKMFLVYVTTDYTDEGIASKYDFKGVFHTEEEAEALAEELRPNYWLSCKDYGEEYAPHGEAFVQEVPLMWKAVDKDYRDGGTDGNFNNWLEYDFALGQYKGVEVPRVVEESIGNILDFPIWWEQWVNYHTL